jgi:hypothetical protein
LIRTGRAEEQRSEAEFAIYRLLANRFLSLCPITESEHTAYT